MGEPVFSAAKVRLYLPCWMRCLPAGPMLLKYSPAFQGSSAKRGPIGRRRCLRCSSTADRRGGLRTFIGSSGRIMSAISRLPSTSKKNACGAESMRQGMEYKAVTTKIGRSVFSIWLVLQGSRKGNPPSFYRILVRTTALLVPILLQRSRGLRVRRGLGVVLPRDLAGLRLGCPVRPRGVNGSP